MLSAAQLARRLAELGYAFRRSLCTASRQAIATHTPAKPNTAALTLPNTAARVCCILPSCSGVASVSVSSPDDDSYSKNASLDASTACRMRAVPTHAANTYQEEQSLAARPFATTSTFWSSSSGCASSPPTLASTFDSTRIGGATSPGRASASTSSSISNCGSSTFFPSNREFDFSRLLAHHSIR